MGLGDGLVGRKRGGAGQQALQGTPGSAWEKCLVPGSPFNLGSGGW